MLKRAGSFFLLLSIISINTFSQTESEPWKPEQLLEPGKLAQMLNSGDSNEVLIVNVGPAGSIKGSVDMGAAHDKDNLGNLKELLLKTEKSKMIVIYCGCCPFKNCPNVRPAFSLLNSLRFTNPWLLDLSHNLKMDWISQGYPMKHN
jgi:hypothetical protein